MPGRSNRFPDQRTDIIAATSTPTPLRYSYTSDSAEQRVPAIVSACAGTGKLKP